MLFLLKRFKKSFDLLVKAVACLSFDLMVKKLWFTIAFDHKVKALWFTIVFDQNLKPDLTKQIVRERLI